MGKIDILLGQRVYLDSNIFIYALESVADFGEVARAVLEKLDSQDFIGVSSELTFAVPFKAKIIRGFRGFFGNLFRSLAEPTLFVVRGRKELK